MRSLNLYSKDSWPVSHSNSIPNKFVVTGFKVGCSQLVAIRVKSFLNGSAFKTRVIRPFVTLPLMQMPEKLFLGTRSGYNMWNLPVSQAGPWLSFGKPVFHSLVPLWKNLSQFDRTQSQTSVGYRASGAPNTAAPLPRSTPHPALRPRAGRLFLWFLVPPYGPAQSPAGPPLKIAGTKRGPVERMTRDSPQMGEGAGDCPRNTPPCLCNGRASSVKTHPAPPRNEH